MSSEPVDTSAGSTTTKKSSISTGQVTTLVVLLFVGFISGGYYFGTQMNFAKMENPGGAQPAFFSFGQGNNLKKWYWLHTRGSERAGYVVAVTINGQLVDKFSKPDVDVDVSRFVKPGRNVITYAAKSLPIDQRSDSESAYLKIELKESAKKENEKKEENKFENGDVIVDYKRQVTDTQDFNDTKEFEIVE